MNLYCVRDKDGEWQCFVFESCPARAKMRIVDLYGGEYINMRCRTLKKGVNIDAALIVDSTKHEYYPIVQELGFSFEREDE